MQIGIQGSKNLRSVRAYVNIQKTCEYTENLLIWVSVQYGDLKIYKYVANKAENYALI